MRSTPRADDHRTAEGVLRFLRDLLTLEVTERRLPEGVALLDDRRRQRGPSPHAPIRTVTDPRDIYLA